VERIASGVLVAYLVTPKPEGQFGWSHGAVGLGFAMQWIFSGLFAPPAGWLGDRYGVRRTMFLAALLFIAASLLVGTMTQLWHFYLYFGVLMSASLAVFQVPLVTAVTVWFKTRLGEAMGLLQSTQGLASVTFAPLMVFLLVQLGWKWAFWLPGIAGGLLLLLLIRFFREEPAEMGLRPLGAAANEPIQRVQSGPLAKVRTRVFLQHARHTNAFWNLIGIHFWGCAGHAIIIMFLVALAQERGLSPYMAAGVLSAVLGVSSFTRFAVPIVADRLGSKGAMAICFFLQGVPVLLLLGAHDAWQFYLFAVLFGIGYGGESSAFPIINRQYYGNAPTGTVYGWQMLGAGIGMAAGAFLGGFMRELTGSYTSALILSFALSLAGAISILVLPTTSCRLCTNWEESLPTEARSLAPPRPAPAGD
jgi:MFS family permease